MTITGTPSASGTSNFTVTATDGSETSYLTVQPAGESPQLVSSVNFVAGQTAANPLEEPSGASALGNCR